MIDIVAAAKQPSHDRFLFIKGCETGVGSVSAIAGSVSAIANVHVMRIDRSFPRMRASRTA